MPEPYDVIIYGAGLVGLTLANCLNGSQLRVALIDVQPAPKLPDMEASSPDLSDRRHLDDGGLNSGYASRVSAINIKSFRLLERFGVWQQARRSQPLVGMRLWDSAGTAQLSLQADDIQEERLGMIVENRELIHALNHNLHHSPNISVLWQACLEDLEQSDDGYRLALDARGRHDLELSCQLLVGADGGNSHIRRLTRTRMVAWSYKQAALVTTIQTEQPHKGIARQWFTDEGPLAFLPLPDPNLCSIVWSVKDASAYLEEAEGDFCQRLSFASDAELGMVLGTDRRLSFPLVQQHCFRYVQKHLALVGDAAHTIHPLAGQGANLGFADASELAQVILQCALEGTQPGDLSVLRAYERARQPHNLAMAALMELLKRLYGTQHPGLNWLRNRAMHWIEDQAFAKSLAIRVASGLI